MKTHATLRCWIKRGEIDEEVDSLYRTILDAIVHYDPGLPE
nr:hypothetical protein [Mesorhizobium carmichaelinearum]